MVALLISVSFLSCVLAYAGLALMLRPARLGRGAPRFRLRIACLATSVWALAAWGITSTGNSGPGVAHLSAILLLSLWLWQLEPLARWQEQPRWFQLLLSWVGVGVSAITLLAMSLPIGVETAAVYSRVLPLSGLLLAALGLFAIEQTYRNASAAASSAIRWFCLGMGGLFAAELVGFAEILLLGKIPVEPWVARGIVYALCALAIGRGALRMPNWSFGMSISRHVVFYTTSFTVIGGYLVLLSFAGWLLLRSEGWGPVVQLAFAALGGLTLVVLLFSATLLRRWRVFISTHFYAHRYDYRLEWLRFIRTLSEVDDETTLAQKCIRAVSQIVESPRGILWRRNDLGNGFERVEDCGFQQSAVDANRSIAAAEALPAYLERTGWLIDLVELQNKPRLYENLQLDAWRYGAPSDGLIVPLLHIEQLYGWLVLDRPEGMNVLTFEDRDLLKTAGRQIAAYLVQHDADARLAEAHQFEAYNRMTAFVMHDLKNLAAQLQLVSQNAVRHKHNPEFFDDAMRTVSASAARMTKLIAQLTGAPDTGTMNTADLADIVERAAKRCSSRAPAPQVTAHERPTVFADVERLGAVIEHAIRNAQDATPPTGEVRIEVDRVDRHPVIRIADTGCGMDQAFIRERLFRPFDTTKGTKGMGIGAFQLREYLRSLGGTVEVQSTPGEGARFTLLFPAEGPRSLARRTG